MYHQNWFSKSFSLTWHSSKIDKRLCNNIYYYYYIYLVLLECLPFYKRKSILCGFKNVIFFKKLFKNSVQKMSTYNSKSKNETPCICMFPCSTTSHNREDWRPSPSNKQFWVRLWSKIWTLQRFYCTDNVE